MSTSAGKLIVGITDYVQPPFDVEQRAFGEDVEFIAFDSKSEAGLHPGDLARCHVLLVWHTPITQRTVRYLESCRIVVRYGVGYDAIDIPSLTRAGIPFCNTPDYGTEEVADTALAMIMGLQRRVFEYDFACRFFEQGWQEHTLKPLARTNTRTVGIVGVGRIGTAVANRLKAFGVRLIGFDPFQPSGHEKAVGYQRVHRLEELLRESDIITIHALLTPETRGMVGKTFLDKMKKGAILVNTARGQIIESLDLIEVALREGRLAGVGLDVLPDEPPGDHPLIRAWRAYDPSLRGRLVINPHTSYYSTHAWEEMRFKAAETAAVYLRDGYLRNQVLE